MSKNVASEILEVYDKLLEFTRPLENVLSNTKCLKMCVRGLLYCEEQHLEMEDDDVRVVARM